MKATWLAIKMARLAATHAAGFEDTKGQRFWFGLHGWMMQGLHEIDMDLGGSIGGLSPGPGSPERERYLIRSLMEEAIASSQIEGAVVTRSEAKEMLKTGRKPRTRDEQMVLNNYRTISWLREHKDEPLTKSLLFEIHRRITEDTLDDPSAGGRFRLPTERVQVVDERDNEIIHDPPPAEKLEARFADLCAFANDAKASERFLHPVIRAIILHFWLAYDHPFVDGNGRTARALFYWYLLRSRYWLFEFLSISRIVAKAPVQYVRAFLNTETDEADLTYFILFHLRVVQRARKELHDHLDSQRTRNEELTGLLRAHPDLNHRQRALLTHAIRHGNALYTIASHRGSHGVTYETSRTDLADLAERGFLLEHRIERRLHYAVPADLPELLRRKPKRVRVRRGR
jgi:Fic family protein